MKSGIDLIVKIGLKYKIDLSSVFYHYHNFDRFYHTLYHIEQMISRLVGTPYEKNDALLLAIIFHDVIYDIHVGNNELRSARFFRENCGTVPVEMQDEVVRLIMLTKDHDPEPNNADDVGNKLVELDLWDFIHGSLSDIIDATKKIFKEYQFVNYSIFQRRRIEILTKLKLVDSFELIDHNRVDLAINYVACWNPLIGLYAGSFNPFHIGHYNILQKSEKIFDKVIIAVGNNPDKKEEKELLPLQVTNREIIHYKGLLTDLITSLPHDVTLIRGIRNSTDLQYEQNQLAYMEDFFPKLKTIYIPCDKEYEHVSSSSIRSLLKIGSSKVDNYLLKK